MRPLNDHLEEFFAAIGATIVWFLGLGFPFIILGTIAIHRCIEHGMFEYFMLGAIPMNKFLGAEASNLTMALMCGTALVAIAFGLLLRYIAHKDKLKEFRKRGIRDMDKDGNIDTYTDRFLDDF